MPTVVSFLVLVGCADSPTGYEARLVEGLPSINTHRISGAWEQEDGSVLILATSSEDSGLFRLGSDSLTAERLSVDIQGRAPHFAPLVLGPHHRVPTFVWEGRIEHYDPETDTLVDLGPDPGINGQFGAYVYDTDGRLLLSDGSIRTYDASAEAWNEVETPGLLGVTYWSDRPVALSVDSMGELSASGYTPLATCSEDCENLNWGYVYNADNGEVWIQENWRWWAFDGDTIRSLGMFPNPGVETASAEWITQVVSGAVLGERIFMLTRHDYSQVVGWALSWKPGEAEHFQHGDGFGGASFVAFGDKLLVVPYTNTEYVWVYSR